MRQSFRRLIVVAGLMALVAAWPAVYAEMRGPWKTGAAGGGTPSDNTVTSAKVVNGTLVAEDSADDTYTIDKMANGNWTLFTITNNAAAFTDADLGGIIASGGALTLDTGAVSAESKIANNIIGRGKLAFGAGTWPETDIILCVPGAEVNGVGNVKICHSWTNLTAAAVSAGQHTHVPFAVERYAEVRVVALMSTAAVTGDLIVQCDDDPNFGSATTLAQSDNPGTGLIIGTWTAVTDCGTPSAAGDFTIRAAMVNGDTTEDPAARMVRVQFR